MIAIKGMEMPRGCYVCPLLQGVSGEQCCSITGEPLVRIRDCPLIEIVTCKDCTYDGCAKAHSPNHFCADGERRE